MEILAHRGQWLTPSEKNTHNAFELALSNGFGIETDLRDAEGHVVISHDMPKGGEMVLDEFLSLCAAYPNGRPLALNIKADGLQVIVKTALERHGIRNFFLFDMAVPDALGYLKLDMQVYSRCSEYEEAPAYFNLASGIWLDAFHSQWYGFELIKSWLSQNKSICIVSPELHGRPHREFWQALHATGLYQQDNLSICTDFPLEAKKTFHD